MLSKPSTCDGCPLKDLTGGFVPNDIQGRSELIVGEAPGEEEEEHGRPFIGGSGQWLNNMLKAARSNRDNFDVANTMCCRPPDNVYPGDPSCKWVEKGVALDGLKYCRQTYLDPIINSGKYTRIITLGEKSLNALTGREGITLWRGSPLPLSGGDKPLVVPTLHPAFIMRQATLASVMIGDLKKQPLLPPEVYNLAPTIDDVRAIDWKSFAFDFEWDAFGKITLCGLSNKMYEAVVVPFYGEYILELRRIFENAEEIVGQNIVGADTSYIEQLGWDIHKAKLWDTMLMQHLVQPDMRHGLAFIASVFTSKVFWKGKGKEDKKGEMDWVGGEQWKTWDKKNALPRELGGYGGCKDGNEAFALYNARDTDATWQAYHQLRFLLDKYNLHNVYENISVPLGFICRDITRHGLKIDKGALIKVREELEAEITRLDGLLPEGLKSFLKGVRRIRMSKYYLHLIARGKPPVRYAVRLLKAVSSRFLRRLRNLR
jgi:uracil-DNA glycosylase